MRIVQKIAMAVVMTAAIGCGPPTDEIETHTGALSGPAASDEFRICMAQNLAAPCYVMANASTSGCTGGDVYSPDPSPWSFSNGSRRATLLYDQFGQTSNGVQWLLRNGFSINSLAGTGMSTVRSWKSCLDVAVPRYGLACSNGDSPQDKEFLTFNATGWASGCHVVADRVSAPALLNGGPWFGSYKSGPNRTATLWQNGNATGASFVMGPNVYKSSLAGTPLEYVGVRAITFQ